MIAAVIVMLACGTPGGEASPAPSSAIARLAPVCVAGDPPWPARVAPLLSGRLANPITTACPATTAGGETGAWLVSIRACTGGAACVHLALVDPSGAVAAEKWPLPEPGSATGEGDGETVARTLAAYIAAVLRDEAALTWTPAAAARAPVPLPPFALVEPDSGRFVIALFGHALMDVWNQHSAFAGGGASLRWFDADGWWAGGGGGFESAHEVEDAPRPVERWSVPLHAAAGWHSGVFGSWRLAAGGGIAARVVRLAPEGAVAIERFSPGALATSEIVYQYGHFDVGATASMYLWARRQELREGGVVTYQDPFVQLWLGIVAGVSF